MVEPTVCSYADLIASLPVPRYHVSTAELREAVDASGQKVVVLDDDPTGCQTVHDTPIWTAWDVGSLRRALREPGDLFYIITNSRSMAEGEAAALNKEIVANLAKALSGTDREIAIVSRSDSTLRGYYPAETDALRESLRAKLGYRIDGTLIIPFFQEGGRLTINDVHWVRNGDELWPAAQTESARDPAFGYRHSNLREWVEEKTGGRVRASHVSSIGLEDIRLGGMERVAAKLGTLRDGQVAVVNAVSYDDMNLFVMGLLRAEIAGGRYLYRTAASFVRSRAGQVERPLLTRQELLPDTRPPIPGLVVFGSFVPRSTEQLSRLVALEIAQAIELRVEAVVRTETREGEIERVVKAADRAACAVKVPVVYTTRRLVSTIGEESLHAGRLISSALVDVVRRISFGPRWILAKGGITSHDVASHGLGAERSMTPGQISPGVPVWTLGPESRYPGLPYIVFPGNVGQADTVAQVVCEMRG